MKPISKKIRVVLLLLVIAGGVFFWHLTKAKETADSPLNLYGNIDIRTADLAFTEQERLTEVLVKEGERVASGQVIARLKTDRLKAQIRKTEAQIAAQKETVKRLENGSRPQEIERARAEVAAAKAKVKNARNNFNRIKKTSGVGATSEQSLDDAKTSLNVNLSQLAAKQNALELIIAGPRKEDIAAAKSNLEALKATLYLLNLRLTDMTLTAPAAGVIQTRILEPGELANPNRPVVTLALTDPKWVRTYVAEPDLGRLFPHQKADVVSDAFADHPFKGYVGFISPVAEFTPKSVETEELRSQLVYEVRVFVIDPKNQLRLGMPVTVTLAKKTTDASKQANFQKE
jgi:HlyD family secretion protein